MKYFVIVIIAIGLLACDGKTPAASGYPVPLYMTTSDWMSQTPNGSLPPGTQVFVVGDTLLYGAVDPRPHGLRIEWGNSTAFCLIKDLIPDGVWAAVIARDQENILIYDDPKLSIVVDTIKTGFTKMVVGKPEGKSRFTNYTRHDGHFSGGYLPAELTFDDPLNVEFYDTYVRAGIPLKSGNTNDFQALIAEEKFAELPTYQWFQKAMAQQYDFSKSNFGVIKIDYAAEREMKAREMNWSLDYVTPVPEANYPGLIEKVFVFADSSEMNAGNLRLKNHRPWDGKKFVSDKKVMMVRFQIIPNKDLDVMIGVSMFHGPHSNDNAAYSTNYSHTTPGEPYWILVNTKRNLCGVMTAIFHVGEMKAVSAVYADCD